MTMAHMFGSFAEISGARRVRLRELRLIPSTSTYRFRRGGERPCQWRRRVMPLPMSSQEAEDSAMPRGRSLILFDRGDEVTVHAGEDGIRFLLVSGKPLEEPVAWYGPIVMNTQEQLRQAFRELDQGTFLRTHKKSKATGE